MPFLLCWIIRVWYQSAEDLVVMKQMYHQTAACRYLWTGSFKMGQFLSHSVIPNKKTVLQTWRSHAPFFILYSCNPTYQAGLKKISPHEYAKPNANLTKKESQRAMPVSQWRIVQRIVDWRGKEKWGVPVSYCFCAYVHRINMGNIFFIREIFEQVAEIFFQSTWK